MRTVLALLAGLLVLLALTSDGRACSCLGRLSTPGAFASSSDVFIATVTDLRYPPTRITNNPDGSVSGSSGAGPGTVTLTVQESLKGVQDPEVRFPFGWGGCSYPFELHETYLVYADRENGTLNTSQCTRTRPISRATQDLKYIRGSMTGERLATLYGDVFREVLDADGKPALQTPFEELIVVLKNDDTYEETTAEKSGEYEVTMTPGKYEVWVERRGLMVSRKREVVAVKDGESKRMILPVNFE